LGNSINALSVPCDVILQLAKEQQAAAFGRPFLTDTTHQVVNVRTNTQSIMYKSDYWIEYCSGFVLPMALLSSGHAKRRLHPLGPPRADADDRLPAVWAPRAIQCREADREAWGREDSLPFEHARQLPEDAVDQYLRSLQGTLRRALNSLALFAARSLPLHLICRLVLPQPNINRVSQGYATIAPHSRSTISAHTFRIEVRQMRMPTMEHRKGKLTGHQAADCTVTISKMDGVESSRTITDVSPHVLDGDYKLAVAGESSTSRWRRDKNGWSVLA
jgi:hypothetical protein